jgi:hypothetical protein
VALPQDYPPFAIAPRRRVSHAPDPFTNACGGALNLRVGGCFIALLVRSQLRGSPLGITEPPALVDASFRCPYH